MAHRTNINFATGATEAVGAMFLQIIFGDEVMTIGTFNVFGNEHGVVIAMGLTSKLSEIWLFRNINLTNEILSAPLQFITFSLLLPMPLRVVTKYCLSLLCLVLLCPNLLAQDSILHAPVNLKLQQVHLRQVIDTLEKQHHVSFAYDADALPLDSMVSVQSNQTPLKTLLYDLLSQHDVDVSWFMGRIVIGKCERKALQPADVIKVSGSIIDASTDEPLPYANISIPDEPIGTISNQSGEFEFILPRKYIGRTIAISSIGYTRQNVTIPHNDTTVSVVLFETAFRLPEVKVMAIPALVIIKRFMENRDKNYLQSHIMLDAFFRETIRQDTQYVEVSEAVIEVLKPPYALDYQFEKVRFIKGRKNSDVARMNMVKFRLQGGPYYFSRMDAARYFDFLPQENLPDVYKYSFQGYEYQDGRMLYKIGFSPYNDNGELLYEGEFYIDSEQYALVAIDFRMTRQTLKESRKYLIRKDSRNVKASPYFAIYHIDYRPFQNKWVLNRVKGEIKVKIKDKIQHFSSDFEAITEMMITDFRPVDGERLKYSQSFKPDYVLSEHIETFDPMFWDDYNVIKPNDDLNKVIKPKN